MSRIKISEYSAKKMIMGDAYRGVALTGREKFPRGTFVVKVDQGVKKRMKQGLLAVGVNAESARKKIAGWRGKGYSRFLAEPLFVHEAHEERYLSLERVRDGIRILYARKGGIEIEAHPEEVSQYLVRSATEGGEAAVQMGIPVEFLTHLIRVFTAEHMAFLELNPLVVRGDVCVPLDAAALVDSAGAHFPVSWGSDDIINEKTTHEAEARVRDLASTTPASLKLNVLNPDGALFFLLSGGGGSIVIADEAELEGVGRLIGNYGEYSGGPTREETYLYAREVIALMFASKAKRKALVIAGGVANFTDVQKTFAGIIDALKEKVTELRANGVRVFVRRGGPNERAGLAQMHDFLETERLLGSVAGSDAVITAAIDDAIAYIKSS